MRMSKTAGPSTSLRSGRDDNFVAGASSRCTYELSSRPERSGVEGPAVLLPFSLALGKG